MKDSLRGIENLLSRSSTTHQGYEPLVTAFCKPSSLSDISSGRSKPGDTGLRELGKFSLHTSVCSTAMRSV